MSYILEANGLTKHYGSTPGLEHLSVCLPQGKIIGLLGPNGSGKTTFLKLCAGLLSPTAGSLTIDGKPIGLQTKAIVSYLPDRTYLQGGQTIAEQLDYFEDFYADFDRQRAERMLSDLHLDPKTRFRTLSKGNREKVQLVLVMSRRARLYLLDEPIGGVDPAARDYILHTIVQNFDRSATVLISTHLIADVEPVLDEFLFLHRGQIIRTGTVAEVKEQTGGTVDALFREVFKCLPNS